MDIQKFKRGQVWWCNLDLTPNTNIQGGKRPVIIVSNDSANRHSNNITIVPCTTADKKELPTHLRINLTEQSTVLAECVTTIPNTKLENYIGTCDEKTIERIDNILKIALGLKDIVKKCDTSEQPLSKPISSKEIKSIIMDTTSNNPTTSTNKRGRQPSYQKADKIRFMNDYENHNTEYMLKKYNIKDKKALQQKAYIFRRQLKEESV